MSDYPSDAEVDEMFGKAWETCRDKRSAAQMATIVRLAIDWARANPAPQEPPAPGELPEHAQESGWQHDAAEDLYWRGDREEPCGLVEFCDRVGVVTVEGDVQADDLAAILAHRLRAPAEPPDVPKPTSGDKPIHGRQWPSKVLWKDAWPDCTEADPRNPILTPEPIREPDPWALPDEDHVWVTNPDRWPGEWLVQTPRGWWWRGTDRPADGDEATQALCDLIARRNREDPPKGGETP